MVRTRPDLVAELYKPQPFDFRGEELPGTPGWYSLPVFTAWDSRLFVRFIHPYILDSQRHADAPRLTDTAREGLALIDEMADSGQYSVRMDLLPGDMQFVNNYHMLHDRTPYQDDRARGLVRHLQRLWLETDLLPSRPLYFRNPMCPHWSRRRAISRVEPVVATEWPGGGLHPCGG
jgi:hypothetical protein